MEETVSLESGRGGVWGVHSNEGALLAQKLQITGGNDNRVTLRSRSARDSGPGHSRGVSILCWRRKSTHL